MSRFFLNLLYFLFIFHQFLIALHFYYLAQHPCLFNQINFYKNLTIFRFSKLSPIHYLLHDFIINYNLHFNIKY